MNLGDNAPRRPKLLSIVALIALLLSGASNAVDNPDIQNLVAEFELRARFFEGEPTCDKRRAAVKGGYQEFLLTELGHAYTGLTEKLNGDARRKLIDSQRQWEMYRASEFIFIDENWQPATFGSSYVASRIGYRAAIIRARIILLLDYAQNY